MKNSQSEIVWIRFYLPLSNAMEPDVSLLRAAPSPAHCLYNKDVD
jgi:hypothetical protein